MGSNTSREHDTIPKIDGSYAFVQFVNFRKNWSSDFIGSNYCSFGLMIKYQRYRWMIHSRFSDIVSLDESLVKSYPSIMQNIKRPKKFGWRSVTDVMLSKRGEDIANYLQNILNIQEIFLCLEIQEFLGISQVLYCSIFKLIFDFLCCSNRSIPNLEGKERRDILGRYATYILSILNSFSI